MKDTILGPVQRFWHGFLKFTPGQKVVTIAVVLGLAVGGFIFSTWASPPTYAPLFTNLAPTDASAMIDKLNSTGTPYELAANGTSIMVPEKDVYATRLKMSSAGLPTSGTSGYSLLDSEGVTTSEFKQHVDYQRALEGELAKTVKSINGVLDATVHLAIPTQTVFDDGTKKPTGAVLLTTAAGTTLSSGQVQSVVNLVSSSVPGLTPDQVSVSDATGKVLSVAGYANAGAAADTRTAATKEYETRLNASVQQMLDQMVGAGHSVVTVNADLDFDKSNSVSQSYVYTTGVPPLAESNTTETYNGAQAGTPGVLGAAAAAPTAAAPPSGTGGYNKTTGTKNNAVGQVTDTRNSAPGKVRKLNVAVLLDKNAPAVDQTAVQQLVSSAVALDPTRGDTIALAAAPFDKTAATAAADAATKAAAAQAASDRSAQMVSMAKTVGIIVLVLVVLLGTWIANRRRRRADKSVEPGYDPDEFLSTLNYDESSLPPAPQDIVPPSAHVAAQAAARKREQNLAALAENEPKEVARLLSSWLNEKDR